MYLYLYKYIKNIYKRDKKGYEQTHRIYCKTKNIDYSKITFENIDNEVFEKRNGSCYNGIVKKFAPRWMGWKYIDYLRSNNIYVKNLDANNEEDLIHLDALDLMSSNYYTIQILSQIFS